jgi:hypothetical protein
MNTGTRKKPITFETGMDALKYARRIEQKIWARVGSRLYEMYPGGRVIDWTGLPR